jgi:dihydrofolate synthase / folylpolyglutamate synthase
VTQREAVAWVEGLEVFGMRLGLERIHALLRALGDPQRGIPAIHVVGSNGKSSTTRIAATALHSQGLRTGAYLSPHITGWHERIEVDGDPVTPRRFASAVSAVRLAADELRLPGGDHVTQFEALTAAAFLVFARARCDAMVIEAGLGGRYDASNVLDDAVVVLTNVSLEHTAILGPTEAHVAAEKLAVAPDSSDRIVVGRLSGPALPAVHNEMRRRSLSAWEVGSDVQVSTVGGVIDVTTPTRRYPRLSLGPAGRFQRDNLAAAIAAVERLLARPLALPALRRAVAKVGIPGRLESFPGPPLVVLDGAHNPAGIDALVASLSDVVGRRRPVAVVSVLDDKDTAAMVAALASRCRAIIATRSSHPRAEDPEKIAAAARAAGCPAVVQPHPWAAVEHACGEAGARGAVLVTGSLYLLSDVRALLAAKTGAGKGRLASASGRARSTPPPPAA